MLLLDELSKNRAKPRPQGMGRLTAVKGPVLLASIPGAALGDMCEITLGGGRRTTAEVVAFAENAVTLAPHEDITGAAAGGQVKNLGRCAEIRVPPAPGAIIDAFGRPLAAPRGDSANWLARAVRSAPPCPLSRRVIDTRLATGIRSIDCLCPIGYGQRIGLMAKPGVGKSTLLGMIARNAEVDITIAALVGERGREVNDFIADALGPEGLARSVVVVATSDQPALVRSMAAAGATAIAEYHRSLGKRVLLLVDSLTRTARAIREVGLAAGEIPVRQGLTPSVYSELPKLLERTGDDGRGSITAIYTLLDYSEQEPDPLADEVRSLLDGQINLDSGLAERGIRPAIDFTSSISRLLPRLLDCNARENAACVCRILGRLKRDREIVLLGGTPDHELKTCLDVEQEVLGFLHQERGEKYTLENSAEQCARLSEIFHAMLVS